MTYCIYQQAENILSKLKKCPNYPRRIEYTMLSLKEILLDAEEKQEHNLYLRNWLKEIQNIFSQIEASIDEFEGEVVHKQEGVIGKQVLDPFSCLNKNVHTKKMENLFDNANAMASKICEFNLTGTKTTHSFLGTTEVARRLMKPSWNLLYPLNNGPKIYQDGEYDYFLNDFKEYPHGFFHIVGEAGTGKSTLAKFVYNHSKVVEMFSSRLWICVEEEFDTQRLIKEILISLSCCPETGDNLTEKDSCSRVERYLRDKTFLLVFQDISIKNLDNCSMFTSLLWMGNHGSKIIVTTQTEEIADAIGLGKVYKGENQSEQNLVPIKSQAVPVPVIKEPSNFNNEEESIQVNHSGEIEELMTHQTIFKIGRLSEKNSVSLFKDYACKNTQEEEHQYHIGKALEIVEKCKGVPFAIKCFGNLISSETTIEWNNAIQMLEAHQKKDGSVLAIIRLCYVLMPSHLQYCFLYCSQLLNGRILSSNDVIQLWMAHGLLNSPKENYLSSENIGENYFKELCSRCFLQEIGEYGLGYLFTIHPLIHKFGDVLAQEQGGDWKGIIPVTQIKSLAFRVRDDEVLPSAFLANKCISKFQFLRLLNLGNADLNEIPKAIGTMKDLRYLELQGNTKIKRLPNSICNLQGLQTLILASCSALEELPKNIRKLINLRYLWVTSNKLHLHKNGIGTMNSLRFLAIGGCDNLQDVFEQRSCLVRLETLMIYDCKTLKSLPNEMNHLRSLQNLVIWKCKELTLTLTGVRFRLRRFAIRELPLVDELPEWLKRSTETLKVLEIIDCPIKVKEEKLKMYNALESKIIQAAV